MKYKKFIADAFLTNAKQLAEQVKANRLLAVGESVNNIYWKDQELNKKLEIIEKIESFEESISEIKNIITLAKQTLSYYRHYRTDRFLFCLLTMWIGWITLLFVNLSGEPRSSIKFGRFFWIIIINTIMIIVAIPLTIEYAG